ncbi:MAG TPA: alkyl sulfatase dimerization domain-containing protein [Acidimicrobiales bacterium]|nr:alkyl sulfatase dimerization domain-containing protein [Acidimicrobiales bacterium]
MARGSALELADRLWRGEASVEDHHPMAHVGHIEDVADRTAFLPSFANVSALATDEGLLLVDTGSQLTARTVHEEVRSWNASRLNTAVYSHGHIDHVFGVALFDEEARTNGWPAPSVVAHEALPPRFDRYILTAGYNGVINQRQFQIPHLRWPTEYRYPDATYADHHEVVLGGERFELHHARGETDDHTWTWAPDRKVLCCGDFFIWASPNAGNPQKVQRYPKEWAIALREMAALGADVMLPGHGLPIVGADRIVQALTDTAELLESLHDQTLALMNQGARLDEIIHTVRAPAHLLERPYLQPVYDEPEFVVRNVWRLYGGWYDGNPAQLKPARDAALAAEVAALAGGALRLAGRARELAAGGSDGELRLAGHLAELAALAAPDDAEVHATRAEVFQRRVDTERSTMSKGVFAWAAKESRDRCS